MTGKAFRRLVNKIPGISGDEVELVADWFEEEYPLASPAFNTALPSVDFAPPGNIGLDASDLSLWARAQYASSQP